MPWAAGAPKSRPRSGQLRQGSGIQASPRKARIPGASPQHAASVRSGTRQNSRGSSAAAARGLARAPRLRGMGVWDGKFDETQRMMRGSAACHRAR